MIEVYIKGKKKDDIIGLVDGKKYYTKKKKLWGYLEGNVAKAKKGYPLLYLKDDGTITLNEDWDFAEQGFLEDGQICYIGSNKQIFSFQKDKGEIHNHLNNTVIYLRGEGIELLTDLDFFGISAILLELFAGAPEEDEGFGELINDILDDIGDSFN